MMNPTTHRIAASVALLLCVSCATLADPPPGYYDSVDGTNSATLRTTLHEVIDDHQRFPYTSGSTDTWDILELADQDPNNASNILDVYKNASILKFGGGNGPYNREHTWPKSFGFPDNTPGPYTDCHMLFLCDPDYNTARSNHPYRTCNATCSEKTTLFNNGQGGGSGEYPGNSNWRTGSNSTGTWETWIGRRGDVARALFYMDVRYEGGADEPDLILTDDDDLIETTDGPIAYMGILSVLLQWHVEDPVDEGERDRNDVVFSFQQNRNPFIDNPEWVACLFSDECDASCSGAEECNDNEFCNGVEDCADSVCVSGSDPCPGQACNEDADTCMPLPPLSPWINELHYDNSGADTGEFLEVAGPAGLDLAGWRVLGYNGNGGGTYDTLNLSGVIPDQGGCLGVLDFDFIPMQNGSPDGLALLDASDSVVVFISYEGPLTATSGPAAGMTATDIGVSESGDTPAGHSLQLTGSGAFPSDFVWLPAVANTRGQRNTGQTFDGCIECSEDVDCDDDDACTADTCTASKCTNEPITCPDDGNGCTDTVCDPETGCGHTNNSAPCDDEDTCTENDTCSDGSCAGTDITCPPGQSCVDGECLECLSDAECNDNQFCNGAETCLGGQCQDGSAVQCDDGAACTADSCNEDSNSCDHEPDDSVCDDGDPCDLEECHPFVGCISFPDDTTPPNITCPSDTTIGCKEPSDPKNAGEAVAVDDCDPLPLVTFEDATEDNGCDAPGFITRTWTAVDASGNDASCDQLITILSSECPQDLDTDGVVGAADLAQLLGNWGPCEGCAMDFDGNGQVDAFDLALLLGAWGVCE